MDRRTQRRTQVVIPVQVSGIDAQGEHFEESTEAIDVSRRGLSILTKRDLPLLSSVTVLLPGRGPNRPGEGPTDFLADGAVMRVQKEGEMNRVGIRFIGATLSTYTSEGS